MDSLLTSQELKKIYNAAQLYKDNLVNKDIAFLYNTEAGIDEIKCHFAEENFAHLVGLKSMPKPKGISATEIYHQCLNRNLEQKRCLLTHRKGVIQSKLDIIGDLMKIGSNCQLIGQLDETLGIRIKSDSLINASSMSIMSFSNNGDVYIPNSALKRDIREISLDETRSDILCSIIKDKSKNFELGMKNFDDLSAVEMKNLLDYMKQEHSDFLSFDVDKYKCMFEDELDDKTTHLAHVVLEGIAKGEEYKHYEIVEDSKVFDDGLMLIVYPSEDVKRGLVDGNELMHICIDIPQLADEKVVFEDGAWVNLDSVLGRYNINLLEEGKMQNFNVPSYERANFLNPPVFSEIKTAEDIEYWAQAVDDRVASFMCLKDNPSEKMLQFLDKEHELFGKVDKNKDCNVIRWGDYNIMTDDVREIMREQFSDIEHLECAMNVWMNWANDENMDIDDRYIQMIRDNNATGVYEYYLENNTIGSNNETVFYDTVVLQELIDARYIDEVNQDVPSIDEQTVTQDWSSREFEILSDGEEIPFDVQQSQADRSVSNTSKQKTKPKQKMNTHTNMYKKTEQWDESRTGKPTQQRKRPTMPSPQVSIAQAKSEVQAYNAQLKRREQSQSKGRSF